MKRGILVASLIRARPATTTYLQNPAGRRLNEHSAQEILCLSKAAIVHCRAPLIIQISSQYLLFTKNISLQINYMLRLQFLFSLYFIWSFESLEVP